MEGLVMRITYLFSIPSFAFFQTCKSTGSKAVGANCLESVMKSEEFNCILWIIA